MRLSVRVVAVAAVVVALAGCGDDGPAASSDDTAPSATAGATTSSGAPADPASLGPEELAAAICASSTPGEVRGHVQNPLLGELSGLVASEQNHGVLWAHNDSGGDAEVYAIGPDGADLGVWEVRGADAVDWEEMASGYDVDTGEHSLYFADIGDNNQVRDSVTIYGVPEPAVDPAAGPTGGATATAEVYELTYADGPHDAEAFVVEPGSGDFTVLTKGWGTGISQVFRASDPEPGRVTEMAEVGAVNLKDVGSYATAADADDRVVVVRTYEAVVVWPLVGTIAESLAAPPCTGPSVDEAQGEAIALAPDGRGYITISEGRHAPIHWFPVVL